jgi:hypothetical protein
LKARVLALAPLLFAAAFLLLELAAPDHPAAAAIMRTENEAGKALCLAGCVAAALAFERGDYLRLAWLCLAVCQLGLLLGDATQLPVMAGRMEGARGALLVGANVASVVGTGMLARAWNVAGLEGEGVRGRRAALFAAGLGIALLIEGWPLIEHVRRLLDGDVGTLVDLVSDLADAVCFALVVPVLQTALALRGGALLWPWALLTLSGFCWILYDVAYGAVLARHAAGAVLLPVGAEALRALGTTFTAAAGLAQRRAVVGAACRQSSP